jgi:hypothetical protein
MNRTDADRLWANVQALLRAPPPPADAALRRAARLLASNRADAVELLLAQWLAQPGEGQAAASRSDAPAPPDAAAALAPQPVQAGRALGLREAALLAAAAAGGAWVGHALAADDDIDAG